MQPTSSSSHPHPFVIKLFCACNRELAFLPKELLYKDAFLVLVLHKMF